MYRINIEEFEGPLDLLLFFIRRDELDIFDIPIAQIADEYLAYVRLLERIDLDSVGDFLYMAALLVNIKARMLLPSEEVDEEGEPIDPRRELVERLLEYIRYKEASQNLGTLHEQRADHFTRGAAAAPPKKLTEGGEGTRLDASVFDLISALRRVLTEAAEAPTHDIERETFTIEQQRDFLLQRLATMPAGEKLSFVALAREHSKSFIITTFLAVLEMARQGELALLLASGATDFYLSLRPEAERAAAGRDAPEPDAPALKATH